MNDRIKCPKCGKEEPAFDYAHVCGPVEVKQSSIKTREEIITSMCYTWRHDYGLLKEADPGGYTFPGITAGMTREEQQSLWQQMAQLFDNDIAPYMEMKNGIR